MNINGSNIFLGAYAERNQQNMSFNRGPLTLSEEKQAEIKTQIEEAMKTLGRDNTRSVSVSISQEDRDFLCSEEGYKKMQQDAADLYVKNAATQTRIAAGRENQDAFWKNTGNQWLILSEHLYNADFYTDMTDEEVKEMENTLAQITSGMDHLSRTKYTTGIEFCDFYEGNRSFLSSGEALMELESSTSALRVFADKYVSEDKRASFDEMIERYYSHNSEIIEEYVNPYESFNKVVHKLHEGNYSGPGSFDMMLEKNADNEHEYDLLLGGISKSREEKMQFMEELKALFENMRKRQAISGNLGEQLKELYINYATDSSSNEGVRSYVWQKAEASILHIQNYWMDLVG